MRGLLTGVAAALLFVSAQAHAQSLSGNWDASYNTPGGPRAFKIVFVQDGEKLTGTVKREAGDSPLAGTVKGANVDFSYTIAYNGNPITLSVSGKVVGDSIKGTVDFGGGGSDVFQARRAAPSPRDAAGPEGAFERPRRRR